MFYNPLETTVCQIYDSKEIKSELERAYISRKGISPATNENDAGFPDVLRVSSDIGAVKIPAFFHPVILEVSDGGKVSKKAFIDIRNFSKIVAQDKPPVINKKADYENLLLRAILQLEWVDRGAGAFTGMNNYALTVFTRWLGGLIARRYGLDPQAESMVYVILSYYWMGLFKDFKEMSSGEMKIWKTMVARKLTKVTYLQVSEIANYLDEAESPQNINDLCDVLSKNAGTIRLEKLNRTALLEIIGQNSWYGANAREIVGVGLEHPPTFIALVYQALNERTYRKTTIGTTALMADRSDAARTLTKEVRQLVADHYSNFPKNSY